MLVQLTDLHIRAPGRLAYHRVDTARYLRDAIASVLRLRQPPDAVVVTGDLTDFAGPEEYEHLQRLLQPLTMPVFLLPGNHDSRDGLRRAFPSHAHLGKEGFVQYSVQAGPFRLIALDTTEAGRPYGALCAQRLAWLADTLDRHREERVLLAMHHPPFATLIGHMDRQAMLQGAPELEALVSRHPNIERILCGHLHRAIEVRFGGTIACTTPGPAHQVALDLAPDAVSAWVLEPPAFRVLALDAASDRVVSHLAASGAFDGPHPFYDADGRLID